MILVCPPDNCFLLLAFVWVSNTFTLILSLYSPAFVVDIVSKLALYLPPTISRYLLTLSFKNGIDSSINRDGIPEDEKPTFQRHC